LRALNGSVHRSNSMCALIHRKWFNFNPRAPTTKSSPCCRSQIAKLSKNCRRSSPRHTGHITGSHHVTGRIETGVRQSQCGDNAIASPVRGS
jgi:hypothetical protein